MIINSPLWGENVFLPRRKDLSLRETNESLNEIEFSANTSSGSYISKVRGAENNPFNSPLGRRGLHTTASTWVEDGNNNLPTVGGEKASWENWSIRRSEENN